MRELTKAQQALYDQLNKENKEMVEYFKTQPVKYYKYKRRLTESEMWDYHNADLAMGLVDYGDLTEYILMKKTVVKRLEDLICFEAQRESVSQVGDEEAKSLLDRILKDHEEYPDIASYVKFLEKATCEYLKCKQISKKDALKIM